MYCMRRFATNDDYIYFLLKFPAAMFSTIAPLVRLNPFHAPQLELHQNSCGPRKRPIESEQVSCARRSLAAASAEGKAWVVGKGYSFLGRV